MFGFKKLVRDLLMSSDDIAIRIQGLTKSFQIYNAPQDRLKQFFMPRLLKFLGKSDRRYYKEFKALEGVSFEVKKGETVGIVGRNGSGKSTLLQMICGTLAPTDGQVETHGRIAALLELGSGFNPEFSGRENVYMNATVLGLSQEEVDDRFDEIIYFADIGDFLDQPVKTYSSGMMVRLAFAVIAHVNADILIVDEALAVGDAFFSQKCMRFLREFMKTGTVLFVSHDTASVKSLCSSAIWLEKGMLIQEGSPKDVCELYLEAFFEAQQGKSSTTRLRKLEKIRSPSSVKDQRLEFINASNLRNDIALFEFDSDAASFGKGGAEILGVQLLDGFEHLLTWIVGGETVIFRVFVYCQENLTSPIIGFHIKDKLGQTLFGDNTFLTYQDQPVGCSQGDEIVADFVFNMPLLPAGEYTVSVAIADGTQEAHVQHHWIHDALHFKSESSSVSTGLVGIPMQEIKMFKKN